MDRLNSRHARFGLNVHPCRVRPAPRVLHHKRHMRRHFRKLISRRQGDTVQGDEGVGTGVQGDDESVAPAGVSSQRQLSGDAPDGSPSPVPADANPSVRPVRRTVTHQQSQLERTDSAPHDTGPCSTDLATNDDPFGLMEFLAPNSMAQVNTPCSTTQGASLTEGADRTGEQREEIGRAASGDEGSEGGSPVWSEGWHFVQGTGSGSSSRQSTPEPEPEPGVEWYKATKRRIMRVHELLRARGDTQGYTNLLSDRHVL